MLFFKDKNAVGASFQLFAILRLTPWCSGGPSLFSFNQDIRPVLFLLGVALANVGSFFGVEIPDFLGVEEEIPDPDSASPPPPFDTLLHFFAA